MDIQISSSNSSDHFEESECKRWVVDWTSLDNANITAFAGAVEETPDNVFVPYDAIHCGVDDCYLHKDAINDYYEEIISCIRSASRSTVAKRLNDHKKRVIPGWTEYVEERHVLLGDIYSLWALVGKPRQGYIYSQLCIARSRFKYALRFCLKNEKDLRIKALADKFPKNPRNITTFWKEVRRLNSNPPLAQAVGGVSGESNIAAM